jgi:hypothetical protein
VSGLPPDTSDFATLPPHFKNEKDQFVLDVCQEVFGQWSELPGTKKICVFVLASLVYHSKWIFNRFHFNHPVRLISLFRNEDRLNQLRKNLCPLQNFRCACMSATGVPRATVLQGTLESIRADLTNDGIRAAARDGAMDALEHNHVVQGLLTAAAFADGIDSIKELVAPPANRVTTTSTATADQPIISYKSHKWGGSSHKLPFKYTLPSVNLQLAHELWWLGSRDICPLNKINPQFDFTYKSDMELDSAFSDTNAMVFAKRQSKNFSEWRVVMKAIQERAQNKRPGLPWTTILSVGPTPRQEKEMFQYGIGVFYDIDNNDSTTRGKYQTRPGDMKVSTARRKLVTTRRKRKREAVEEDSWDE